MFLDGEVVEEDVVLRTDPHELADLGHLFADVLAEDPALSLREDLEAGEHLEGRGFSGAVMSEQTEYLVLVHRHVEVLDGDLAVRVDLRQALDFEDPPLLLEILEIKVDFLDSLVVLFFFGFDLLQICVLDAELLFLGEVLLSDLVGAVGS